MTAYDRTAYWVQSISTGDPTLYSPSVPPSEMDGYLSSPPSDAGSTYSIPPRMILRYDDGRPDIPISRAGERHGRYGGRGYDTVDPRSYHDARHRGRQHGTSYANPSFVDVQPRRHDRGMHGGPEEIRVLPAAMSHAVPRSRSLPRSYDPAMGPVPQTIHPLPPSGSYAPVSHAYQRPPKHSRPEGHAYPSVTSHTPYPPANGFHHSPHIGPNSVIYSHSAPPVLMRQGHPNAATHSRTGVPEHIRGIPDSRMEMERSASSRARAFSMSGQRPGSRAHVVDRSDDSSSDSEADTGYYATRSRGKSTPSTGKSVATATSSGMSPVTPTSAIYGRRPFFQRLFNFAGKFSHTGPSRASSVVDAGDLHRRHSISGSRR